MPAAVSPSSPPRCWRWRRRSSDAARETSRLISNSITQVSEGVELVGKAGQTLDEVSHRVDGVLQLVREIANSASEQAVVLANVNASVATVDRNTQQNAYGSHETLEASREMTGSAVELARKVARFQLGDARGQEPRRDAELRRAS